MTPYTDTRSHCSCHTARLIASMLFVPDPNPVYLLTWCTWLDVVSAGFASTWPIHYAHTSVTCIVTPWQSFITKRRVTVVGIVKGLWTVWSSRSVNLTTHLHVLPKLRNCGAIPLFLLYACIACSRTSFFTFTFTHLLQHAALDRYIFERQFEGYEKTITSKGCKSGTSVFSWAEVSVVGGWVKLACKWPGDLTWLVILIIKYDVRQCM